MAKEAIIIGAGPAGSVAAILLARGGWRVTVIEQHRFPRDKVCGECLSALGSSVLGRIGVSHAGAVELARCEIHSPSGESIRISLPRPMWGLSRKVMDAGLVEEAARAGARVLQPMRCESLLGEALRPSVTVRDLCTNQTHRMSADFILLADGKSALLPHPPSAATDLGIKSHWTGVDGPRDTIELFGFQGHYGGLAAIEDGRWNLACSVPAERIRTVNGDLDRLLDQMRMENPIFRRRLEGAKRLGEWLASPLPHFGIAQDWPMGVIPLGNAAAAIEPIGGEGMGLAMRSAELAAKFLLDGRDDIDVLRREFRSLWGMRRIACRIAGISLSNPVLADAILPLAASSDALERAAMRMIGK